MHGGIIKKGFTLLELTISMLFVTLLSISIAVVINNVISSYQRGSILSKLNSTGNSIVDDMRDSVHDALYRTELGEMLGGNVSIIKTAPNMTIDGVNQKNIPIYGIFCSGSYTYFWNSGYFFTDDATFPEKQDGWARFTTSGVTNKPPFRLVKVQDVQRKICFSIIEKARSAPNTFQLNNGKIPTTYDLSILNDEETGAAPEVITVLQNDNNNDLALYDLLVEIPATNLTESLSLYNVSFILGTTTGGVNIAISGNSCAAPIGDPNWNNSCAASRFNFVAQSNATDTGIVEQVFLGQVPPAPEVTPPKVYYITYKNTTCPSNPLANKVLKNTGVVAPNTFSCTDSDFLGWNTSELGNGESYQPGDSINDEADITLYAIWKARVYYTVTYYGNGNTNPTTHAILNSKISSTNILEGSTYTIKTNTWVKRGNEFKGWGYSSTDTTPVYTGGEQITVNSNIDLYAIWSVGSGDVHTVTPGFQDGDMALDVLLLIPNYNGYRSIENTGDSEGADTGISIMKYSDDDGNLKNFFDTDVTHYNNPSNERFICETLEKNPYFGYQCPNDCINTFMATIYRMFSTSTSPAVLYIKIDESLYPENQKIKSNTIKDYTAYISNAFSPVCSGCDSSSYNYTGFSGYIGEAMGVPHHPHYYDFMISTSYKRFLDRLVATSNLPNKIYGKNATIQRSGSSKIMYWIIAKVTYNASSKTASVQPVNVFTNASPATYINK